jgi:hypothetical protein
VKLAAPLVIAAHVETLPTLPGWAASGDTPAVAVFEGGFTRRDDLLRWCTVGYVPNADGPVVAAEPVSVGQSQNREEGTVSCSLVVAGPDVAAARGSVFGLLESWAQWLATDRTLAGAGGRARLLGNSDAHLVTDVTLVTTRAGATASALVTITYTAHTYG